MESNSKNKDIKSPDFYSIKRTKGVVYEMNVDMTIPGTRTTLSLVYGLSDTAFLCCC